MKPSWNVLTRCFMLLIGVSCAAGISAKEGTIPWLPITPQDLAMKDSPADPGAPAIVLYRETDTDAAKGVLVDYRRIKIFREAGRKYADVSIPFEKDVERVEDVEARTIHPDGKVIDFQGDIYDKVVAKTRGTESLAKTFSLPDVQPGSIIEYKYRIKWQPFSTDIFFKSWAVPLFSKLPAQRATEWMVQDELFTRRAHFTFRPVEGPGVALTWFQLPPYSRPEKHEKQFELDLENIAAFQKEAYMPPEEELKGRVNFFYFFKRVPKENLSDPPAWFWREQGKDLYKALENLGFLGASKSLEKEARELTAPNDSPQEKLRKLYQRAQQIRNRSFESDKTAKEEKHAGRKENQNLVDVLKHGYGYANEVNLLFVALARAAGFDAYIVEAPSRRRRFFHANVLDWGQISSNLAEVRQEGKSLYLDPGNPYCPFGLLPWEYTGVYALRLDENGGVFVNTPDVPSTSAVVQRQASLELGSDGNLQGKLQVRFIGEEALWRRLDYREEDNLGRKKELEEEVKGALPPGSTVELTHVGRWDTSEDTLEAEFTVKIQGLGSSTGRRLLLPLGVLQTNERDSLRAEKRVYPVYFRYPFQEIDDVSIHLPKEYQVETLSAPHRAENGPFTYGIEGEAKSGDLHIRRHLTVNGFYFGADTYPAIREFFSEVRTGDEEPAVLKRAESPPPK